MKNNNNYVPVFKEQVVLDLLQGNKTMYEVCQKYSITYQSLGSWKDEVMHNLPNLLGRETEVDGKLQEANSDDKKLIFQLEKINLELDFLKGKLADSIKKKNRKEML